MTFQKKRSINSERKQLKEQKEEAESYQRAKEQLNIMKTKLHLWELYQIDRELTVCEDNISEKKERKERKSEKRKT